MPPSSHSPPQRVVAIGDLNGACDALVEILWGLDLIDRDRRWTGAGTRLIQLGDLFNRGDGAREAFELLAALQPQASRAGGQVSVLLGNHEVMTALRNEAYCTIGEYLSFATPPEREAWPRRVSLARRRLYRQHAADGTIQPVQPRLDLWKMEHAPGRAAMRRELGPRGRLGKMLRALPVATRVGDSVFLHAGLNLSWARHGVDGLNELAARAWGGATSYDELPSQSIFRSASGPLWNRTLSRSDGPDAAHALARVLGRIGAKRLVVGHTPTIHVPGGEPGRIAARFGGSLVCLDVGIVSGPDAPRAALVIEDGHGYEWTPEGRRRLWRVDESADGIDEEAAAIEEPETVPEG